VNADWAMTLAYLRLIGFDPEDVRRASIEPRGVTVTRFIYDDRGRKQLTDAGDDVLTEEVFLPWKP
jgi:hypothetical protein